jgi:hypothetical protein
MMLLLRATPYHSTLPALTQRLAIWLAITVMVYFDRSNRRQIFLTSLYTSISYLVWALFLSVLFEVGAAYSWNTRRPEVV